jgi:hypothetical protein
MQSNEERIALQADITEWLKFCQQQKREPDLDGIKGILDVHKKQNNKQIITVNCHYFGPILQYDISTIENPATGERITMADIDEIYCKHTSLHVHIKGIANPILVDYIDETEPDYKWPVSMEIFDAEGTIVASDKSKDGYITGLGQGGI